MTTIATNQVTVTGLSSGLLGRLKVVFSDTALQGPDSVRLALHDAIDAEFASNSQPGRGPAIISRTGRLLGMSHDQIGRILRVSGETVRRWERGMIQVPDERLAELDVISAALDRLQALFLPDRLAQVIRRPAGLFGGEASIAWIERGRITEVVDRYETALSYQQ